jgi:16S rRNA G966 N2-methylase RsmD
MTNHTPEDSTDRVVLQRELFLALLDQLAVLDDPANLRTALADLNQRIASTSDPLHTDEGIGFQIERLQADLQQIASARTIERARYYLQRLRRAATDQRTSSINEIDLNRWKEYEEIITDSLWLIERRDSSGVHRADYWGNFVPQIPHQLLQRYTRRGDWVLDPFAGSGTTLIESQRLGRNSLGLELQSRMVEHVRTLVAAEANPFGTVTTVEQADSTTCDMRALLERYGARSAQLAILHPPYHDIIRFSDDARDLSAAASTDAFLDLISAVAANVAAVLDRKRYLALVIGDKYAQGEWIPLGFLTMQAIMSQGFRLKSIVVKNFEGTAGKRQQKELWRYRALVGGFYVFKHEYIFVLQKL